MTKTNQSLTEKLKMNPKQTEILKSYQEKLKNTKIIINKETYGEKNILQTKKSFYNRAVEIFIETKFGNDNHFGSMINNFEKIIEDLKLEETIDFKLKTPAVTTKSLNINSSVSNNFNDFEVNSIFECTFFAKKNITSKNFSKAIETIESGFIAKYNTLAKEEIEITKRKTLALKKEKQKKEVLTYGSIGFIIVLAFYLYLKFLK